METTKEIALMNCNNLDELLDVEFGKVGTPLRDEFDKEVQERKPVIQRNLTIIVIQSEAKDLGNTKQM